MISANRTELKRFPCARRFRFISPEVSFWFPTRFPRLFHLPRLPCPRRAILAAHGALLAVWLFAAPPLEAARHRPPHVGVVHPSPRFCLGQERSQRDLRILRMAFRLRPHKRGAAALPWFYKEFEGKEFSAGQQNDKRPDSKELDLDKLGLKKQGLKRLGLKRRSLLTMDVEGLWGNAGLILSGPAPIAAVEDPDGTDSDRADSNGADSYDADSNDVGALMAWRSLTIATVPGLAEAPLASPAQFLAPPEAAYPFWRSRLGGSALLPYYSAQWAGEPPFCLRWPKEVNFKLREGPGGYTLQNRHKGGPFRISAFLSLRPMLRALQRGRLDALLINGGEVAAVLEARLNLPQPIVGRQAGTQQIILKPRPALYEELGARGMAILSAAIPRGRLADAAGRSFVAATAFIHNPSAPPQAGNGSFLWNARTARRSWLQMDNPPLRLSMAVLRHPLLQRVAENLASQWKKTLGLIVELRPLSVEKFHLSGGADAADFALLAVDLDNGSLQDLWREALAGGPAGLSGKTAKGREAWLQKNLPYLPLIRNVHFLLAPSPAAYRRVAHLCPGCVTAPLSSYRRPARR